MVATMIVSKPGFNHIIHMTPPDAVPQLVHGLDVVAGDRLAVVEHLLHAAPAQPLGQRRQQRLPLCPRPP